MPRKVSSSKQDAQSKTDNSKKRSLRDATHDLPTAKRQKVTPAVKYVNSLSVRLSATLPGQIFVWGSNDNGGQLGLDVSEFEEVSAPLEHPFVTQETAKGAFGPHGIVDVAAGGLSTLLLDSNGTVWSCGANDNAALGRITENVPDINNDGATLDADTLESNFYPLQSLLDDNYKAVRIAAGDNLGVAIDESGNLRMWGTFKHSEGNSAFSSTTTHQFLPTPVSLPRTNKANPEKFVSIVCGANHILALTTHGYIYTWGVGESGQLGRRIHHTSGRSATKSTMTTIPEKILLGSSRTRKTVVIGAGEDSSFAVDDRGDVWAWGKDSSGLLGFQDDAGSDDEDETPMVIEGVVQRPKVEIPTKVLALCSSELGNNEKVVQIAGGSEHTLFLTSSGRVFACGAFEDGQLGLTIPEEKKKAHRRFISPPQQVAFPGEGIHIVHISANLRYNIAVDDKGVIYSWGLGLSGELGLGEGVEEVKKPRVVEVESGGPARKVECGSQHVVALLEQKAETTN